MFSKKICLKAEKKNNAEELCVQETLPSQTSVPLVTLIKSETRGRPRPHFRSIATVSAKQLLLQTQDYVQHRNTSRTNCNVRSERLEPSEPILPDRCMHGSTRRVGTEGMK